MKQTGTPLKLTLKELVDHYDGFLKENERKSQETHGTYQRALRAFVTWFPADRRFQFRVRDVERYRRFLAEVKGLQNVSIATYMTALRRFCQYLIDIGVLDHNPAATVVGGSRPERHSRTFLSASEVEALLAAIDIRTIQGARDLALVRIMLGCALGERECLLANVGDITSPASGTPVINVQGKGRKVKDEAVAIPAETFEAIEEYLDRRFAEKKRDPEAPLFSSLSNRTQGERMTARGMREAVNRWLRESGVKQERNRRLTPFSLRHTAGLLMVDSGASVEEVMQRMRIDWRPTAQLYFKLRGRSGAASTTIKQP